MANQRFRVSRRAFLKGLGIGSGTILLGGCATLQSGIEELAHVAAITRRGPVAVIDQSGQLGNRNVDTIFAALLNANRPDATVSDRRAALVMPASAKQLALKELNAHYRQLRQPYLKLHVVGVSALISELMMATSKANRIATYQVDEEFPGKRGDVRAWIMDTVNDRLLKSDRLATDELHILRLRDDKLGQLAHQLAHRIYRLRANRTDIPAQNGLRIKIMTSSEVLDALRL